MDDGADPAEELLVEGDERRSVAEGRCRVDRVCAAEPCAAGQSRCLGGCLEVEWVHLDPRHLQETKTGFASQADVARSPSDRRRDLDQGQRRLMDGETRAENGT